jgi:hypothetical protein
LDYTGEGVFKTPGVTAVPDLEASENVGQIPTAGEGLRDAAASSHVSGTVRYRVVEE